MMTGEQHIDYEQLAQDALRGIVRRVLMRVAKSGLPGQHHFYISFNTGAPGVSLSSRLKERYPEEMTIVLQHRFWDLMVNDERFEVKLTFNGLAEALVVPFAAIRVFFDPSVPYGLQFEGSDLGADTTQDLEGEPIEVFSTGPVEPDSAPKAETPDPADAPAKPEKKPRAPRKPRALKDAAGDGPRSRGAPATILEPGKSGRAKQVAGSEQAEPEADNDTKVVHLDKFRKK